MVFCTQPTLIIRDLELEGTPRRGSLIVVCILPPLSLRRIVLDSRFPRCGVVRKLYILAYAAD